MPFCFFWNDVRQEKALVAASASCDAVEIYYTLENKAVHHGGSCTVSSQAWFSVDRPSFGEERLLLD